MNIQDLKNKITSSISNNKFSLDLTTLNSSSLTLLSNAYFKDNTLTLNVSTNSIQEDSNSITVNGSGKEAPFADLSVSAKFFLDNQNNVSISINANANSTWKLSDSITPLSGTIADDIVFASSPVPSFTLASDAATQTVPQMKFAGTVDLKSTNAGISTLLGKDSQKFTGTIEFSGNGSTLKSLLFNGPEIDGVNLFIVKNVTLNFDIGINIFKDHVDNTTSIIPFLRLTATIPFTAQGTTHKLPISVQVSNFDTPIRFSADINDAIDAAVDEIGSLTGGTGLSGLVPTKGFKLENMVKVSSLFFDYDLKQKKISLLNLGVNSTAPWTILNTSSPKLDLVATNIQFALSVSSPFDSPKALTTIGGDFSFGQNGTISISALYPDWAVQAYLKQGSVLKVSEIIKGFLSSGVDVPEVDIYNLDINISSGNYSLNLLALGDWEILSSPLAVAITEVEFSVSKTPNQLTGNVFGQLYIADVDFSVSASYDSNQKGWAFSGTAATESTISITTFIGNILTSLGLPDVTSSGPQVDLKNLGVNYNTGTKAFGFGAESTTQLTVPFFDKKIDLDVKLRMDSEIDSKTSKRTFDAIFAAQVDIGSAEFTIEFEALKEAKTITGSWQEKDGGSFGVEDIAKFLGISTNGIDIPSSLNLSLSSAMFVMDITNKQFTLAATSKDFGTAFFTAGKDSNSELGFVFGVNFNKISKLSQIPEFGKDLKAADFLTLDTASIIITKGTFNTYKVPQLPDLSQISTTTPAAPVAQGTTLKLASGITFACAIDMEDTGKNNTLVKNLNSITGHGNLVLQFTISTALLSIRSILEGSVKIPTGGNPLIISNPVVEIDITEEIFVKLGASFSFTIDGVDTMVAIMISIGETEASVSGNVTFPNGSLPAPPGVKGLHLTEVGLLMGIFFEPPSLVLGLSGKFKIGEVQTKDDEFSFVLQIGEEEAVPLYLSFYIDELDMGTLVTLFTDQEPSSDLMKMLNEVSASELSFYYALIDVILPDNTTALAGFGFSGELDIFGFGMFAELEIKQTVGIVGKAQTNPIDLKGILQIEGDGKEISRNVGSNGNVISNKATTDTPKDVTKKVIVKKGGPNLEVSTSSSPFLKANWIISLFDIEKQSTDIEVGLKGITFDLSYSIKGVESFVLKNTLKGWTSYSGEASFGIKVDQSIDLSKAGIPLGSIHLKGSVGATFKAAINSKEISFSIDDMGIDSSLGSFNVPDITLSESMKSLKKLPKEILDQIVKEAEKIFFSLISDPLIFAKHAYKKLITTAEDVGVLLNKAYGQVANDVAKTMKEAGYAVNDVASSLKAAFGDGTKIIGDALSYAGYGPSLVVTGLFSIGKSAEDIGGYLNSLGLSPDKIKGILNDVKGVPGDVIQEIGKITHIY